MCQYTLPPQQGWQCPVCQTVNAPWSLVCLGCPPKPATVTMTFGTAVPPDGPRPPSTGSHVPVQGDLFKPETD